MAASNRNIYAVSAIKCAGPGCPKTRATADPWFVTVIDHDVFSCRPYAPSLRLGRSEQPVCGQACAVRLFDRFLSDAIAASSINASLPQSESRASAAISVQHRRATAR
jgi:hypothetical protein